MIEQIICKLKNRKIAILGFGREGQSTYHFIREYLPNIHLTIFDQNNDFKKNCPYLREDKNVDYITGGTYLTYLDDYEIIIKSPGISLKNIDVQKIQGKITSQMELLLEVNSKNVIGITGTKGKSTTSSLIYEIIKDQNPNVILVGNIGIPVLSELSKCDENTIIVMEMSSHQLEFLNHSPHIGVILNLFEDHLDHAGSIEHYHNIKLHMFDYQNKNDYMIYYADNLTLKQLIEKHCFNGIECPITQEDNSCKAKMTKKNNWIYIDNQPVFDTNSKIKLIGKHNIINIMVALMISKILLLDMKKVNKTILKFKPLDYRLQNIGTVNNVLYYTDTLATIPEATIEAIKTLENVGTLIFGGMDRGIHYDKLIKFLNECNIENYICMPTTGHTIGKKLKKENKNIHYVETLKEAVDIAKKITKPHTICLLSPAASSYEYFKNYKDKADKFKKYVMDKS